MKIFYIVFLFAGICLNNSVNGQAISNIIVDNTASDGECTIVINPLDPNQLLVAANPDVLYRSSDAGITWTRFNLSPFASANLIGDVSLAADLNGNYYCQDMDGSFLFRTLKSTDYGVTWGTETVFGDNGWIEDKNWLTCDRTPTSPYLGNLYCAWTRRSSGPPDPGYIFVNHSADLGVSWVPRDTLFADMSSPAIPPIGTGLAVGPSGEIGISWGGGLPNTIRYKESSDGGNTWPQNSVVVDNNVQPANDYYDNISHPISFSAQFTSLARDISGGTYNGNIYCVWDDLRNGADNADIFLARSIDGGATWSTQRINDDLTTRNQVVPTVAVDPTTGWVYVAYLDARLNTGSFDDTLNYYLAWSNNGGQTFQNIRVSQQSSTVNYIHSDYMGMDAYGGKCHLLWVGGTGNSKTWTACVTQSQLLAVPEIVPDYSLLLFPAVPNPSIDFTTFDFEISDADEISITVTDINGRIVAQPMTNEKFQTGRHQFKLQHHELNLAAGTYIATITGSQGQSSRKFVIEN
ncbi:hypothetical protein BH09BAC5_BH09BAC5_19160 [soil metagenome]